MKILLYCLLSQVSLTTLAQLPKYVLLDRANQLPIAFATIKVKNKPAGAISNEQGEFYISLSTSDTILISSLGYNSISISGKDISASLFLDALPQIHKEVLIRSKKRVRIFTIGNFEKKQKPDEYWGYTSANNEEFSQRISLPDSTMIYRLIKVSIPVKKFENWSPLLLHIYLTDTSSGMPGEKIFLKPVYISNKEIKKNVLIIDLLPDSLFIENSGSFFISFSWIPSTVSKSKMTGLPFKKTHGDSAAFYRFLEDISFQWKPRGLMIDPNGEKYSLSLLLSVELEELKYK